MVKKIEIKILGQRFNLPVNNEGDEVKLKKMEQFISDKSQRISIEMPFEKRAIMLILSMADDMFSSYQTISLQKDIVYKQSDLINKNKEMIEKTESQNQDIENFLKQLASDMKTSNDSLEEKLQKPL